MPQMGVNPEKIKAQRPQPAGWYILRLIAYHPALNKNRDSINLNPEFEITNPREKDDIYAKKLRWHGSLKMEKNIFDFAHGLGFELDDSGAMPGDWIGWPAGMDFATLIEEAKKSPSLVEKLEYKGPMLGKTMEAELAVTSYQNNPERNEIRQVKCKVAGCNTNPKYKDMRHSTNWIGKSK